MQVTKRNGIAEEFDASKINVVVEWACEDIQHAHASEVCVNAELSLYDGIPTSDIHEVIIDSARNLITEDRPEYSKVAARLLIYKLRKEVWGGFTPPKLYDFMCKMTDNGLYDHTILEMYSESEINKLGETIDHNRDDLLEFAGIRQLCDKYLIQNRHTDEIYETPQFVYMVIAMTLFGKYPKSTRMKYVKRAYSYFSRQKINLPTPVMAGVRTPVKSGASCCLMEMGDDLASIGSTTYASLMATSSKYGIGVDMSNIRCKGAPVRGGETIHTGVIPYLKTLENTIKSCKQGGARRGAGTVTFPIFHTEIEDILQLRDNTAVEEKRVAHLDYSITVSKVFWERFLNDEDITLFSYHEAAEVYECFGLPGFDEVYKKYERKTSLQFKKTIPARRLFELLFKQRIEHGRLYIINLDHANEYSPWSGRVTMSNLCLEILHEICKPINDINDPEGEIGICILAATNMLTIGSEAEHEKVCDVIVRMLDELIDYQEYFSKPAEKFAKEKRSIGVGVLNMAAWLAKKGVRYDDEEAPNEVSKFFEQQQYFLMKSSVELAKEKGPCAYSDRSKYAQGILPDKHYKKDINEFVNHTLSCDWVGLSKDIKKYGIRNSTVSAQMPCESSSKTFGATNGIEPPRSTITYVKSKGQTLPCLIPNVRNRNAYTYAFDMENEGYLKCVAALQRWLCMAVSTNVYYRYSDYEDQQLPTQEVIKDTMLAYKWGIKTMYYLNTDDGDKQVQEEDLVEACEGGACSI
jgi:ribonucleoside-diphosphate reductase alpha chain